MMMKGKKASGKRTMLSRAKAMKTVDGKISDAGVVPPSATELKPPREDR